MGKSRLLESYRGIVPSLLTILAELEGELHVGRRTSELESAARDAIQRRGFTSSFQNWRGYPAYITASLNDEVLNTVPGPRRLAEGDLLKLQVGVSGGGGHAYQSWTYAIGACRPEDRLLIDAGRTALTRAVGEVRKGVPVRSISKAIQETIEGAGFSVNREYVGHGMGERNHEPPMVPCFEMDHPHLDMILRRGQILSIQVIAHAGGPGCRTAADGWNVRTTDGSRSVMLSQMVVVGEHGPDVLLQPRDPYLAVAK